MMLPHALPVDIDKIFSDRYQPVCRLDVLSNE